MVTRSAIRRSTGSSSDGVVASGRYPSDEKFIASDDYFTFAAYEQAQLDHAVCYVLGTPDDEGVGAGGTFPQEKVVPAN